MILLVNQTLGVANIDFEVHCHSENLAQEKVEQERYNDKG